MATIDILLATYNGARFLPEQLASLAAQNFTDWRVILRDDGSSDGSSAIVRRWAEEGGHPLMVIDDGRRNLGAKGNFAALLEASDAPWFACCDQDDVWLPEKLAVMLARGQEAEAQSGAATPLLAYSDAIMVDQHLEQLHPSFSQFANWHLPDANGRGYNLLQQNVVLGCASLGNAALRHLAVPIPPEAVIHDWWLALIAATAGELVWLPEVTVLYRQHGSNISSPIDWSPLQAAKAFLKDPAAGLRRIRAFSRDSQIQAGALRQRLQGRALPAFRCSLDEYALLPERSLMTRKLYALRHPARGGSVLRKIVVGLSV